MSLNTAVIYGSVRRERQGIKAAKFLVNKLEERGHDVTLVDPLEYPHPMLDLRYREYDEGEAPEALQRVAAILSDADGFVEEVEYWVGVEAEGGVDTVRVGEEDESVSFVF